MARLRRRQVTVEGVPAALGDRHDVLWKDPRVVDELAKQYGLSLSYLSGSTVDVAPIERFSAFRRAYCHKASLTLSTYPGTIDHQRAAHAGIDMSGTSRDRIGRS